MAAKAKQVTRLEVDGSVVEIEPMDLEVQYHYSDGSANYRQRSLLKVLVDGVHRGYLTFPKGYGGKWSAAVLRPQNTTYDPSFHKHDDEDRNRYGIFSYYRVVSPGVLNEQENWGPHEKAWVDRNAILAAFPKMVALGRAPSPEEEARNIVKMKRRYEEQKVEDAERKARWARESIEREQQKVEAARAAEEARQETLAGLESIRDRYAGQLTNLEALALGRAIDAVTR